MNTLFLPQLETHLRELFLHIDILNVILKEDPFFMNLIQVIVKNIHGKNIIIIVITDFLLIL